MFDASTNRVLQGGDLRGALNDDPDGELRWYHRGQSIALDIARGLHFLHSHDVRFSYLLRLSHCPAPSCIFLECGHRSCKRSAAGWRRRRWRGRCWVSPCRQLQSERCRVPCGAHPLNLVAPQVMHSDMKARNVLLSKGRDTAKISDVGVARYLNECGTATQSNYVAWTFAYAAPEILLNQRTGAEVRLGNKAMQRRVAFTLGDLAAVNVSAARHSPAVLTPPLAPEKGFKQFR